MYRSVLVSPPSMMCSQSTSNRAAGTSFSDPWSSDFSEDDVKEATGRDKPPFVPIKRSSRLSKFGGVEEVPLPPSSFNEDGHIETEVVTWHQHAA